MSNNIDYEPPNNICIVLNGCRIHIVSHWS